MTVVTLLRLSPSYRSLHADYPNRASEALPAACSELRVRPCAAPFDKRFDHRALPSVPPFFSLRLRTMIADAKSVADFERLTASPLARPPPSALSSDPTHALPGGGPLLGALVRAMQAHGRGARPPGHHHARRHLPAGAPPPPAPLPRISLLLSRLSWRRRRWTTSP